MIARGDCVAEEAVAYGTTPIKVDPGFDSDFEPEEEKPHPPAAAKAGASYVIAWPQASEPIRTQRGGRLREEQEGVFFCCKSALLTAA